MNTENDIEIFSVSELNSNVRNLLEENFPNIWVEGEISNLAIPSSGHMYFSLKDSKAQVRCAFFKGRNRLTNFKVEDGMQVLIHANVSLYEGRGDFQLIVQHMELSGDGALRREFEQLKIKLHKEGLFQVEHKKQLPSIPNCIGVITSATGAAISDILSVLKRRYPIAPVIIYPCQVQGDLAKKQIIQALNIANKRNECDILILARGGGSLEDLWCFNDEKLAREIFKSKIPIVSGIGHEVDITIADFVADVRAATPTAAAELISPNLTVWLDSFKAMIKSLKIAMNNQLKEYKLELKALKKQIRHPGQIIREQIQNVDYLEQKLVIAMKQNLKDLQKNLYELQKYLMHYNPIYKIKDWHEELKDLYVSLEKSMCRQLDVKDKTLKNIAHRLNMASPLAILTRGFSITRTEDTKTIIRSINDVKGEQNLNILLKDGELLCKTINKTRNNYEKDN